MEIRDVQADHYAIPLPVALSDSTHGTIRGFELVTVRVRDAEGAEGVGYTYTVGTGGAAVHALVARDLAPRLVGRDAERIEELWQACGGICTTAAAAAPRRWRSRRSTSRCGTCGRGVRARRSGACSAASTRACPATRAASTSTSRWTRCCARRTTTSRAASAPSR